VESVRPRSEAAEVGVALLVPIPPVLVRPFEKELTYDEFLQVAKSTGYDAVCLRPLQCSILIWQRISFVPKISAMASRGVMFSSAKGEQSLLGGWLVSQVTIETLSPASLVLRAISIISSSGVETARASRLGAARLR
jgi:hypothetical protein